MLNIPGLWGAGTKLIAVDAAPPAAGSASWSAAGLISENIKNIGAEALAKLRRSAEDDLKRLAGKPSGAAAELEIRAAVYKSL